MNFKDDPVAQVHSFEQTVQTTIASAQVAWAVILPTLPADVGPQANEKFLLAVATVTHSLQLLNDAVMLAVESKQDHPDFLKLMTAVTDAVAQVLQIVDLYRGTTTSDAGAPPQDAAGVLDAAALHAMMKPPASFIPGYDDMKAGQATLRHFVPAK